MTQEEKQLLLKDLCSRLPYGVICNTPKGDGHLCSINQTIFGTEYGINIKATERDYFNNREEVIKPYLRPMSSMTEEDNLSLSKYVGCSIRAKYGEIYFPNIEDNTLDNWKKIFYWLNAHHFDYRGLIEKCLAIEVTEENNPYL